MNDALPHIGVPAITSRAFALLPAAAFALGGAVLAAHQPADTAAETGYLTLLGGWVLGALALLAPAGSWVPPSAATLATVALWAMEAGPARGATLTALLVAGLLASGWHRLRGGRLDAAAAIGGSLAVHALLRGGELLPASLGLGPGADPSLGATAIAAAIARLLAPPLLAAGALAVLARTASSRTTVSLGVAVALAAGGFTVTASLPLLALAALEAGWPRRHDDETGGSAARAPSSLRRERLIAVAAAAAAGLLAALRPAAALLAVSAAVVRRLPARWGWVPAAAPLAFALARGARLGDCVPALALLALLPFAPFARPEAWRDTVFDTLSALLLAAGGVALLPSPAGLAASAALLALSIPAERSGASVLQRGWLAFLLGAGALAAAYPWFRSPPLGAALATLSLDSATVREGAALAAGAALLGALLLVLVDRATGPARASWVLAATLVVAVLLALPRPSLDVAPAGGTTLDAAHPVWVAAVPGPVRTVRVVSTCGDAVGLPPGTPIATVTLERNGVALADWTLRSGVQTDEWAAARPDIGGREPTAPVGWSWLPPPGTFFARAYAAVWRPLRPLPTTQVRVTRARELPPSTSLALLRVEVTP